ncbi:hypothetical protein BHE74_00025270 [Ensete ventricosum]|nr:hypothetical protein GW17_00038938 [Ensete ventricosum]RWW67301.1 hypothetical protein BHE74_00025270 [Ensete ventricosum]
MDCLSVERFNLIAMQILCHILQKVKIKEVVPYYDCYVDSFSFTAKSLWMIHLQPSCVSAEHM